MHLRLFSDFSHKYFVTYSQSLPKDARLAVTYRIKWRVVILGAGGIWRADPLHPASGGAMLLLWRLKTPYERSPLPSDSRFFCALRFCRVRG